jgi:hypothetical protein
MNEEKGTRYNLGIITRGYRGRYQLRNGVMTTRVEAEKARQAQADEANTAARKEPQSVPPPIYPLKAEEYVWNANFVQETFAYVEWQNLNGAIV